jgi:DNA-binding protein HU-beta
MNKSELITAVSDASGLTRADATRAVNALLGTVAQRLAAGEAVQLDGFGSFDRTERAARPGRDPRSGDPIEIPARRAARFRPARALKDALQG